MLKTLKKKFVARFWDHVSTAYFARARENGHPQAISNVHLCFERQPLCGYKPHPTMQYLWCANWVKLEYVTCNRCRVLYEEENVK
jgi:hypothetical protein